jgi:hypothetical protein
VFKKLTVQQKMVMIFSEAIPAIRSKLFCLVVFFWAKKELPLVAFFCPEKIQQSFKRLSTSIRAMEL